MSDKSSKSSEIDEQIISNLTAIISVEVLSYSEKYVEAKTVTFYELELKSKITSKTWNVDKRYSEFKTIHDKLAKIFPRLPTIPGITLFKVT